MHRDTLELLNIDLPIFSQGTLPAGPSELGRRSPDALEWARIGECIVTTDDVAVGDCDGVIFLPYNRLSDIVPVAEAIRDTECLQAEQMRLGHSFREQVAFKEYMAERLQNPGYGFREHLRKMGKAIEE